MTGGSGTEREPSPSGQALPPLGLGAEGLRAPRGGRCLERLWKCAGCPQLLSPSHTDLLSPLSSYFLQAMAASNALLLASLARDIMLPGQKKNHHISKATAKEMLENEVHLHEELVNLLQEIENSEKAEEARRFYEWLFWTAAVGLVLFAVICWLVRRRRKRQASPQLFKVFWPDLPEDIDKIDIELTVHKNNRARRKNLALDMPSS